MDKKFFDKKGNKISEGDMLFFDSGSIYKVIEKDGIMCLKCHNRKLPLLELNKITISGILISACRKKS